MRRTGMFAAALAAALVLAPGVADASCPAQHTLVFETQPTTVQKTTAMAPAVVVDVENGGGAVDTGYNGPVTLTYAVDPDGAPEPAMSSVDAVDGVATFPALTFSVVGFGFELEASTPAATSGPSQPFDVVDQLVRCAPGRSCGTGIVQSRGTTGSAVGAAASTAGVLEATGGAFPALSCTARGGVLTFSSDRAQTISLSLSDVGVHPRGPIELCWGDHQPFRTASGAPAAFNPANDDYEGLLPACRPCPGEPCVLHRDRARGRDRAVVYAPPGDPHITF